jgi:hypothetical protein
LTPVLAGLSDPKIRAKGNYEGACPATDNNHEERRLHRIGDTTEAAGILWMSYFTPRSTRFDD